MDMERMDRVLRRVYGEQTPPSRGTDSVERWETLFRSESSGERLLTALCEKNRVCAGELRRHRQKSEERLRALQAEIFLRRGDTCPGKRTDGRQKAGVLSLLRAVAQHYRLLAVGYREAGFPRFALGAEETASVCETLLRKAVG